MTAVCVWSALAAILGLVLLRRRLELNAIAEGLRWQALRIEGERCIDFRESLLRQALVEKRCAATEVLADCANEFESFGHDASRRGGDLTRRYPGGGSKCKAQARLRDPETDVFPVIQKRHGRSTATLIPIRGPHVTWGGRWPRSST